MRDKFKLVKSFARFPFDFFMDVTGKDTVGDVVKTGFLTAGKAMKALSKEKEDRDIYQMDLAKSLIEEKILKETDTVAGLMYKVLKAKPQNNE